MDKTTMTKFLTGPAPTESGFASGVQAGKLVWAEASAVDAATGRRVPAAVSVAEETRVCLKKLRDTLETGRPQPRRPRQG
jgi:hypothetical protein